MHRIKAETAVKNAVSAISSRIINSAQLRLNNVKYAVLAASLAAGSLYPMPAGVTLADFETLPITPASLSSLAIAAPGDAKPKAIEIKKVYITAYSSTPEETDDTPFITASGSIVRDGIVASNFLPFGTKIRIPAIFGDKIFTVEDRMHPRMTEVVDIWMPSQKEAQRFGRAYTEIEILKET